MAKQSTRYGINSGISRKRAKHSGLMVVAKGITAKYMNDGGLTPIDVMMTNMRFWAAKSETLVEQIKIIGNQLQTCCDPEQLAELLPEFNRLLGKFLGARSLAQECAVDCAPYMHPRLVAVKQERPDDVPLDITMTMPKVLPSDEDFSYRTPPSQRQNAVAKTTDKGAETMQ